MAIQKSGKTEVAEIVCAFGDIRGFTKWMRKVTKANEVSGLVLKMNSIFKDIAKKTKCFYKRTGDGCLLVFQLHMFERSERGIEALFATWRMTKAVESAISNMGFPKPSGFRVRLTRGPAIGWQDDKEKDYYSPDVNICFRMLKQYRREKFVCTRSVKEMINEKDANQAGLTFSRIKGTNNWRFNFSLKGGAMKKMIILLGLLLLNGSVHAQGLADQIKLTLLDHVGPVAQMASGETRYGYSDSIILIGQYKGRSIFDVQGSFTGNVKPDPGEVAGADLVIGGLLKLSSFTKDVANFPDWWKFLNSVEYGLKYDYDTRTHKGYGSLQVGLAFGLSPEQ